MVFVKGHIRSGKRVSGYTRYSTIKKLGWHAKFQKVPSQYISKGYARRLKAEDPTLLARMDVTARETLQRYLAPDRKALRSKIYRGVKSRTRRLSLFKKYGV